MRYFLPLLPPRYLLPLPLLLLPPIRLLPFLLATSGVWIVDRAAEGDAPCRTGEITVACTAEDAASAKRTAVKVFNMIFSIFRRELM